MQKSAKSQRIAMQHSDTLLIIPAFNEAENLGALLPRLKARYPELAILVVDDGSRDRTRELVRSLQVDLVSHAFNLGYGAAVQTGYKYALERQYPYLVQMDADGQHEVDDVQLLLEQVKEGKCDLALGSRFLHAESYRPSLTRRLGIAFFRKVTGWLTGQPLTDPTSGFQAMTLKVLRILAGRHFPDDFPDADVLVMLYYYGIKIREIPVRMYAPQGTSMHRGWWRPVFYMVKTSLSLLVTFSLRNHFNIREEHL
jgi:glycosyltransferase involved in cell wall biosynthesis